MLGPGRTLAALAVVLGLTFALAACGGGGVWDQKERGTAAELHENAPQRFKNIWNNYQKLKNADPSGFGVLALDRNLNGGGVVYCVRYCGNQTIGGTTILEWRAKALQHCRQDVRNNAPGKKPDCAIYAVDDKIVWTGPLPW